MYWGFLVQCGSIMQRIKREQLYNDSAYDSLSDELLAKSYELVSKIHVLLQQKNFTGIALIPEVLYLNRNGSWEVTGQGRAPILLSPLTDLEVVIGHYLAPTNYHVPEEYFFLLEPNIKKSQTGQIFVSMLERAITSLQNMDARDLPR